MMRAPYAAAIAAAVVTAALPADAQTETPARAPVTVAAVGDIVCQPGDRQNVCKDAATASLIANRDAAALLTLGDNQYEAGTLTQFRNGYDNTYGRFLPITYPSPGNHEYHTSGARGYFDYFGARAKGGPPGYYAFTLNGWRIYSLNTNCDKVNCGAQQTWLRNDAEANPALCQAMFMHHPRYSSGDDHGSSTVARRFWEVGLDHKFELALAGHDHTYERFARMNAAGGITKAGIQSFVVGTGGKSLDGFRSPLTGSRHRYSGFGVLFLTLDPTGYGWDYRTIAGTSRDAGSATCR